MNFHNRPLELLSILPLFQQVWMSQLRSELITWFFFPLNVKQQRELCVVKFKWSLNLTVRFTAISPWAWQKQHHWQVKSVNGRWATHDADLWHFTSHSPAVKTRDGKLKTTDQKVELTGERSHHKVLEMSVTANDDMAGYFLNCCY